jgi:hypothetical protein
MKRLAMSLAVMALIGANGAIVSARADDDRESTTLFTPRLSGDHFVCSAVNVGHRTLRIDFTVLGVDGQPLAPLAGSDANPTPKFIVQPGTEAEVDLRFTSGSPRRTDIARLLYPGRTTVMTFA